MVSPRQENDAKDGRGLLPVLYKQILEPSKDLLATVAEDATQGVLENIPVVKYFYGLIKTGAGIKERIFIRKLAYMLAGISDVSPHQKKEWAEKLEKDDIKNEFGEKLIMAIDMLDDYAKASWLGKSLRDYIKGEIDRIFFNSLSRAIRLLNIDCISCLYEFYKNSAQIADEHIHEVASTGLVHVVYSGASAGEYYALGGSYEHVHVNAICKQNALGMYFVNHILD